MTYPLSLLRRSLQSARIPAQCPVRGRFTGESATFSTFHGSSSTISGVRLLRRSLFSNFYSSEGLPSHYPEWLRFSSYSSHLALPRTLLVHYFQCADSSVLINSTFPTLRYFLHCPTLTILHRSPLRFHWGEPSRCSFLTRCCCTDFQDLPPPMTPSAL